MWIDVKSWSINGAHLGFANYTGPILGFDVAFISICSPIILVNPIRALSRRLVAMSAGNLSDVINDVYIVVYRLVLLATGTLNATAVRVIWIFIVGLISLAVQLLLAFSILFTGLTTRRLALMDKIIDSVLLHIGLVNGLFYLLLLIGVWKRLRGLYHRVEGSGYIFGTVSFHASVYCGI